MSGFAIRTLKTGVEQLPEESAPEPTQPLPPSKAKWLTKEHDQWHQQLKTDLAMLVHNDNTMDLIEVFCSPNSRLTQTAQDANLKAERWTLEEFDLSLTADLEQTKTDYVNYARNDFGFLLNVDRILLCRMQTKEPHNREKN